MSLCAVIFDLDGVLADTESVQLRVMNSLLNPFGVTISREDWGMTFVGVPIEEDLRRVHRQFHLPVPVERLDTQRRAIYSNLLEQGEGLLPLPGLISLLDELRGREIRLGVASGSPRGDVLAVLRALGLLDRFAAVATASDVARPKPAPDVYLHVLAMLGCAAGGSVAIEDSGPGVASANAAGLRVIAVPSSYTREHDFSLADARAGGFEEVSCILSEWKS